MGDPLQPIRGQRQGSDSTLVGVGVIALLLGLLYLFGDRSPSAEKVTGAKESTWEEVAYIDEDGVPQLRPKAQAELDSILARDDGAEQYVLIVQTDGVYPCATCKAGSYFLRAGEVYRYGITTKGQSGRYAQKYLRDNGFVYMIQFRGTIFECQLQEQIKIRMYPLLPENLARQKHLRLIRPCGNPYYK